MVITEMTAAAYSASACLLNSFLEDAFSFSCVYELVNFLRRRLLACHNLHPPLYHLPAACPNDDQQQLPYSAIKETVHRHFRIAYWRHCITQCFIKHTASQGSQFQLACCMSCAAGNAYGTALEGQVDSAINKHSVQQAHHWVPMRTHRAQDFCACMQYLQAVYKGVYKGVCKGAYKGVYKGMYKGVCKGAHKAAYKAAKKEAYKGVYKEVHKAVCKRV